MLAETGEAGGQLAKQSPSLEDDLDEQDDANDGGHHTRHNQKDRHECVGIRDTELLHVGLDSLHFLCYGAGGAAAGAVAAGCAIVGGSIVCIDARGDLPGNEIVEFSHGPLELGRVAEGFDGAILEDQGRVCEILDAVLGGVAARRRPEVIDGGLHALKVDETNREGEVLCELSVD